MKYTGDGWLRIINGPENRIHNVPIRLGQTDTISLDAGRSYWHIDEIDLDNLGELEKIQYERQLLQAEAALVKAEKVIAEKERQIAWLNKELDTYQAELERWEKQRQLLKQLTEGEENA